MTRQHTSRPKSGRRRSPPLETAIVGLLRMVDEMHRHFSSVVEPFGITRQQFNVLRILRGARPAPLPTLAIAERMIEHTPGITRLLDRLEKKALITRQRSIEDRRQVRCTITDQGLALLQRLDAPVAAANAASVAMLNRRELAQLIRLLDTVQAGRQ